VSAPPPARWWPELAADLEAAHARGAEAAAAGLADAALGPVRLAGPGVVALAEAAVSSATPFLRAPLLARLRAVGRLHPSDPEIAAACPTCGVATPCPTARALIGEPATGSTGR
jgi:hypothetical protein